MSHPKIELHVHLEGTVRAGTLLQIARRNGVPLPADTEEGLAGLYEFRDFAHFLEVWMLTTGALRTERDFRQVVMDYAAEAAGHGAVYLEGIFTPAEAAARGVSWDEAFTGYCDGAQQAREAHGVEVRLTPDIPRGFPMEAAMLTARYAVKYRDRGVVGLGLGGPEAQFPPEPYAPAFALARDGGIGSVPHAGEAAGPASIRGALDALGADRIRHGIRAVDDPGLVRELAAPGHGPGRVPDLQPADGSGRVAGRAPAAGPGRRGRALLGVHRRPGDVRHRPDGGLRGRAAAGRLREACYQAGLHGALCDEQTRAALRRAGEACDWSGPQ